jgi:hypothetical protein
MAIRSANEVYEIIEELLRKAGDNPLTCVDLYEDKRLQKLADSPNRVSDYLGHMWRKGLLQRWYANETTQRARYAYTWKGEDKKEPQKIEALHVIRSETGKPNVTITEEDKRIVLDFPHFTIIVQSKER